MESLVPQGMHLLKTGVAYHRRMLGGKSKRNRTICALEETRQWRASGKVREARQVANNETPDRGDRTGIEF